MELALVLPSAPDRKWKIAQQLDVKYAITSMERRGDGRPRWDFDSLVRLRTRFEDEGLRIAGFEGDLIGMQRIKLGLPGRDEDIELYCCEALANSDRPAQVPAAPRPDPSVNHPA